MSPRFAAALHLVLERSALPYGYTLTVWSTGAMLMHRHGTPSPPEVFLFLAGGGLGFAAVTLLARALPTDPLMVATGRMHATGALQAVSVAVAVGLADLVSEISGRVAWPLGSFTVTVTFLLLTASMTGVVGAE